MKIIVLVKQVPDSTEIRVDKVTGTLIRAGVPSIINPDDLAGVEAALQLKEKYGASVTIISMGPPQATGMLKELYARGVDECILITDRKFAGADTCATSSTLAAALNKTGYDLIIAGRQAIDGDTAQVGPQTAERLNIPQVTYVDDIIELSDTAVTVRKSLEDSEEIIEAKLPCVLTTLSGMNEPGGEGTMAKFEGYKDIYVFVEQKNGEVANVGYELISEARKLVASIPQMNFQVVGVLLGHNIKDKANDVIAHGADKVIVVDDALLEGYSTQFYADALTQVINNFKPDSFLTGATVLGRDLAPRVAARLNAGLTADATKIEIDQEKAKDGEALLLVTRPTFGGNLFGTIVCPDTRPQMATIRPNVFSMDAVDASRTGEIVEFAPAWTDTDPKVIVKEVIAKVVEGVDITKADILVGAGRGAEDCLDMVQAVAEELGGELCASRAVVDDGFADKAIQVGQTGKTVRPSLYIACGISGACQHVAGMEKSDMIIAINRDPQAEIFSIANMGFIGDVKEVLPLLKDEIIAAKKG